MALIGDVVALRDRTLFELHSAHDYYADTKIAWRLVRRVVAAGNKMRISNAATGSVTTQTELAGKSRQYVAEQLAQATFQQFISIFESFFFDLLELWLLAYPRSLSGKKVDFSIVLDMSDKEAIARWVIRRELNEVLYERPTGWFAYLQEKVKLSSPSSSEIERFAECKATRDALVHHRGIANRAYEQKAGTLARFREGEKIQVAEQYHRESWELLRKMVEDICNDAIAKIT